MDYLMILKSILVVYLFGWRKFVVYAVLPRSLSTDRRIFFLFSLLERFFKSIQNGHLILYSPDYYLKMLSFSTCTSVPLLLLLTGDFCNVNRLDFVFTNWAWTKNNILFKHALQQKKTLYAPNFTIWEVGQFHSWFNKQWFGLHHIKIQRIALEMLRTCFSLKIYALYVMETVLFCRKVEIRPIRKSLGRIYHRWDSCKFSFGFSFSLFLLQFVAAVVVVAVVSFLHQIS